MNQLPPPVAQQLHTQPQVVYVTTPPAPVYVPKRTAHGFHMTMTFFTLGLWAPIWIISAILNAGKVKQKK